MIGIRIDYLPKTSFNRLVTRAAGSLRIPFFLASI
jgi:hypothetical protein